MLRYLACFVFVYLAWMDATAAQTAFSFALEGDQQVPPVATAASGHCVGVLDPDQRYFSVGCTHTVTAPTAAHIHRGVAGENGDVVFPFESASSPMSQTFELGADEVVMLFAGELYLNVHTVENPGGEVRGQVPGPAEDAFHFVLSGTQQVPVVDTEARGQCSAVLNQSETELAISCSHTVEDASAAHIHAAPAGASGEVLIPFDSPASPIIEVLPVSATDVELLKARGLYVNVHSPAHPGGEIRGQINRVPDGTYAGSYYDPARDGEGVLLEIFGDPPQVLVSWYSYAADGSGDQIFLIGSAPVVDNQAVIALTITRGAMFGDDFDPGDVLRTAWGTVTVTFLSCTQIALEYASDEPGYGSGVITQVRLTPALSRVGACT